MSPQKRIQRLRSKNKLLLDKLESHSSLIEAEIKYLKRTLRGTGAKFPSGNDRYKNWTKRNSSRQVTEVLSSSNKAAGNDSDCQKCKLTSRGKSCCSTNVGCGDENVCKTDENEDLVSRSPGRAKRSPCHRLKSVRRRKSTVESPTNYSKSIRDIISLIDYSPKSTFVKRMISKFEPYTREVYVKAKQETGNPEQKVLKKERSKHKKVKSEEDPKISIRSSLCSECGKRIKRKSTMCTDEGASTEEEEEPYKHKIVKSEEDPKISIRSSLCSECGKRIKRKSTMCTDEGASTEEEPSKHKIVTVEDERERLKNFRAKNWQDCHANTSGCEPLHCCGHHRCGTEIYGINDRLLAVPLNGCSQSAAHCTTCCKSKSKNSCCAHAKQVLVTIPTLLLDGDTLDASRARHVKGTKENAPISKEVLKKLQRPVPQNSMALRYQKGIC